MTRILRQVEVLERVGVGRTTLWRMEREGRFPRRRQLSGNTVGWLSHEVDAWFENLPIAGDDRHEGPAE